MNDEVSLHAVCVFCGSSPGARPAYAEAAAALGRSLAGRGIELVYGGGSVGLMGVVADAALAHGGRATGVITEALMAREVGHDGLSELVVVPSMHARKAAMADRADAFVMLPGGFGTFEEFFEVVTWTQLGIHTKPCGVLDVEGFFTPLRQLIDQATAQRFIRPEHAASVLFASSPDEVLDELAAWRAPVVDKWLDRPQR